MSIVWTSNKAVLAVVFIMMAVLCRNIVSQADDLSNANLPNPDSYYKLVILNDYAPETGFQFIARDNAPHGSWIHWSLPHTWVIWQLHRGLMVFGMNKEGSLLWAGGGLTMLSMLLVAFFVALAVVKVGSPQSALISGLVLITSLPLFGYGKLVQITHHIFMLVPLAAAAACFFRANFKGSQWQDFLGGIFLGLALWVSPETMPIVLAFSAMRASIRIQNPLAGAVWPVAFGLLATLLTGWFIDPPPPTFSSWALDHISFTWLLFGGILAILLLMADNCVVRRIPIVVAIRELILALILAAICWLIIVPEVLEGPSGLIPQDLKEIWYDRIQELQPIKDAPQFLAYLLVPLISAALLSYAAWRERSLWMLVLALTVLIYCFLGAIYIRMAAAGAIMAALAFGIGISRLNVFINFHDSKLPLGEQILCAILVLSVPLQFFSSIGLEIMGRENNIANNISASRECSMSDILPTLNGLSTGIVLSGTDIGPELLYRTRHSIVSGNYHHNISGLKDGFKIMQSYKPYTEAISLIKSRDIRYILMCSENLKINRGFKMGSFAERASDPYFFNGFKKTIIKGWVIMSR